MRPMLSVAYNRDVTRLTFFTLLLAFIATTSPQSLLAQCDREFSTNLTGNNSSSFGTTLEIKAERTLKLCRLYASNNTTTAKTADVTVWAHPGGLPWAKTSSPSGVNDGQWFCLGTVSVSLPGDRTPTGYTEIPVDLGVLGTMVPGQKWGFLLQSSGIGYKTGSTPYIMTNGDITIDTETWGPTGSASCPSTTSFTFSNFPRQYCGKVKYMLVESPNDVGVASVDSPLNFCAGSYPVEVSIRNFGTNQVTSATLNWTINGAPQTPVSWTGLLDTTTIAARTAQVTLSASENFLSGVPYTIEAWTSLPNGEIDTVTSNDLVSVTRKAAISGSLTIGPGGDYSNFNDAVGDLELNGVCGPVVFKVVNGNYNEQVTIGNINGVSPVNTITFESQSGNRDDVVIEYAATSSSSNWVVHLASANFVTFKDMTLKALGAGSYGRLVEVEGGSTYNTFENMVFDGRDENSTSANYCLVYSTDGLDDYTTFRGCLFNEGSQAMYWEGSSTSSLERGTVIENNSFVNYYDEGLYISYQDGMVVRGNDFRTNSIYSGQEQMYLRYCDNDLRVIGNTIMVGPAPNDTKTGIYLYYCDGTSANPGLVANNFITIESGSGTAYGINPDQSDYQNIYFNTVHINSTSSTSRALYSEDGIDLRYLNNIFINNGDGYAVYTDNTSSIVESDYNVFYTNGTNFGYWGGAQATLVDWQNASNLDASSINKLPLFENVAAGDLHLAGSSVDDGDLHGMLLSNVTEDIDGDVRVIPYRGADEACFITKNTVNFDFVDVNGNPTPYATAPGQVGVSYYVAFPDDAADITLTVRFYTVPGNQLAYTETVSAQKLLGVTLDGYSLISLGNLAPGQYRVEGTFRTKNSCGGYQNYSPADRAFMIMAPGQAPCVVWPGDVNNDGLVNFGDRKGLTEYIHNANLSPVWLNGPRRYRADMSWDALTAIRWEPQAAIPWSTAEGCFMDTDGSGEVNSLDFIAIKLNWMRDNGNPGPKAGDDFTPLMFDLRQNFPNPFNPTTQIQFTVPEPSHVRIVVFDATGREVSVLYDAATAEGTHSLTFDGAHLSSGVYTVVAHMQGETTGTSFTRSIRMNLTK